MAKALLGLVGAFLAAVAAAQIIYRVTVDTGDTPVNDAWSQNRMEFVAWNNEQWTAWISDDAFEHLPQDTANWSRHAKASIAYIGWDGEAWQAKIDGDNFLLALHGNWDGPVESAGALRYRDWSGVKQIRTVAQLKR